MEGIQAIMRASGMQGRFDDLPPETDEEQEARLNTELGNLTGYDCSICCNRGYMYHVRGGQISVSSCKCKKIRADLIRLKKSGLEAAAKNCRLDTFTADEDWQKAMLNTAKSFLADKNRQWLFVSGQSGCGKTHLCTAVAVKMLRAGVSTRYVRWGELLQQARAKRFDAVAYDALISPLKRCRVLYIDDLLKTQGNAQPAEQDYQIAMEIINARYCDPAMVTIISTELTLGRLFEMDEALAGRIAERSSKYTLQIAKKPGRNYRERFLAGSI